MGFVHATRSPVRLLSLLEDVVVADVVPRQRVQSQADYEAAEQIHEGLDAEKVEDRRVEGDLHHCVRYLEVGDSLKIQGSCKCYSRFRTCPGHDC